MRTRTAGAGTALFAAGLLLVGCSSAKHAEAAPPSPSSSPSPSPVRSSPAPARSTVPAPPVLNDHYFAEGDCARAAGGSRYEPVPCDSPQAEAKVIKRSSTAQGVAAALPQGADCPDGTDVALDLTQNALVDVKQNRAAWACLRNLRDPHPGDPGGGGGPGILVGDCVYRGKTSSGAETVLETRCDGQGEHRPEYKVDKIYVKQTLIDTTKPKPGCPDEATVSFTLPRAPGALALDPTVACAEPVD
ncbi:hypothetical protein [Kitasatospora sp. NPDC088134]|uniref:LppU/SCO3897 family protein n=1 Tax=Kitasatospora sp. NPDC088134 TaxID=3364071 RepID=UPI0037FDD5C8